jgi:hypothetical protein
MTFSVLRNFFLSLIFSESRNLFIMRSNISTSTVYYCWVEMASSLEALFSVNVVNPLHGRENDVFTS